MRALGPIILAVAIAAVLCAVGFLAYSWYRRPLYPATSHLIIETPTPTPTPTPRPRPAS